ncbi:DUF2164 domain-containing protein [Oceanobacillus halophilus]|uniref:DUF2164 domain-containing protein n=1 Tax=Oceanobacillus halophilus TaxID=930130 RepID=A0A495A7Q2_9BACI|nr:DUF2164 domain-containing protein [Oceanobacillus halophilus]RKQ35644.1 DUF2164 domain-containing protein [Oceanobacillus halophilus]
MKSKFKLEKDKKEELVESIQAYFEKEMDENIGDLKAMLFLDFIMEEIAPVFYNLGVQDSHAYVTKKLDDLFEIEK